MKLKNKTALITGGAGGIGLAIAKEFAANGAKVAIADMGSTDAAMSELGDSAIAVKCDVTKMSDLDNMYKTVVEKFGKLDIVVANAGIAPISTIDKVTEEHFDLVMSVNLKGVFFTLQKAIPHVNDGASMIVTSSVAGISGFVGHSVYGASKAAVRSMARTFSAEFIKRGIRVNAISPGGIDTAIFHKMGLPEEYEEKMIDVVTKMTPMRRFGRPDEIAKVALFLASDDSSYVVGLDLIADGGMTQL